jgi:glycosyltransferase involved in cell wall biosynthesis
MLIGIDASRANKDYKTGTEWYSFYLIKHLAQIDSKNQYILYTNKPFKGDLLDLTTIEFKEDVESGVEYDKKGYQKIKSPYNNFKVKVLKWPFIFFWTLGRLTLEMIFNKPDVLFVPSHSLPLIFPKKTINTIHDIAFERDNKVCGKDDIGPECKIVKKILGFIVCVVTFGKYKAEATDYMKWSFRFALKRAKKIITVSNFSKNEIFDLYGDPENKIEVVYNGYNNDIYQRKNDLKEIDKVLSRYGVKRPYFLYGGRIEKKKNIPLLIEAYATTKEANPEIKENLVMIGNASYGYDEVKYLIQEFNINKDVFMPGWVEEKDMPYFYSGASAFVFPSRYEGFGIPLLQSMGCGVPLLISNIPPFKEVAQEAAMFFNPNDMKALSRSLSEIITNNVLREELIEKEKERIKCFSWRKCAEETLKVIENL